MSCISGRVVSFTSEPLKDRASDDQYGRSLGMVQNENKIKNIKKEIETLRQKVCVGQRPKGVSLDLVLLMPRIVAL